MSMRRAIGLVLMAVCIGVMLTWAIHPPEGNDSNLLVKGVVTLVTGGGAYLAWRYLVRRA